MALVHTNLLGPMILRIVPERQSYKGAMHNQHFVTCGDLDVSSAGPSGITHHEGASLRLQPRMRNMGVKTQVMQRQSDIIEHHIDLIIGGKHVAV